MGISMRAKLLFGVPYEELAELENIDEMLDDGELDYASPYYDSDRSDWVVGVELSREYPGEAEVVEAIRKARVEFEKLTGCPVGRLITSPDIT